MAISAADLDLSQNSIIPLFIKYWFRNYRAKLYDEEGFTRNDYDYTEKF